MEIDEITTVADLNSYLKENKVTMKSLKKRVFGGTACKVISTIRKNGQPCFDDVQKSHQIWWSTKHAIKSVINGNR